MIILNFMAWNLQSRILFTISVIFSLSYFVLSIGQVIHIWYNHFHPSYDWGKHVNTNTRNGSIWKKIKTSSLFKEIIVSFIILVLLVLIFPILHL